MDIAVEEDFPSMSKIVVTNEVGTWWHFGFASDFVYQVRKAAEAVRLKNLSRVSPGRARISRRRHSIVLSRRIISSVKKGRLEGYDRGILMVRMKINALADSYLMNRGKLWKPLLGRPSNTSKEINLKNFSFIDDPVAASSYFHEICKAEAEFADVKLNFDDEVCLDVGAYLVLAALKKGFLDIFTGGRLPVEARRALEAVKLTQALGMANHPDLPPTDTIWAFPIHARRPAGSSKSPTRHLDVQKFEEVATDLSRAIDKWLDVVAQQKLTDHGSKRVQKIVGEILDNAERHSDIENGDGDWSMAGYMSRSGNGETGYSYRCNVAFLSVGKTIAESLSTAHPDVIRARDAYLKAHGVQAGKPNAEPLETLYAVQDGVTRDPAAFEGRRGGTGLLDTVDLFTDLSGAHKGRDDAALCIVSGSTAITFDQTYLTGADLSTPGERGQFWLNQANRRELSPDPTKVVRLPYRLNGTMVSMVFRLDRDYLESSL